MIKSTINNFMSIAPIEMNADKKLELDNEILPNTPSTLFLVGRMGSGKTVALCNLILGNPQGSTMYNKKFCRVWFVGSHKTLNTKTPIDLPSEQVYDKLTIEMLEAFEESILDSDERVLLIIDDQTAELKKPRIKEKIRRLVFNQRHDCSSGKKGVGHGLWIIITSQKYLMIEKSVRVLGSHYMLFRPNQIDSKEFYQEVLTCQKQTWVNIMKFTYDQPHNFVWYDVKKQAFHKNFNLIEFEGDDDFEF